MFTFTSFSILVSVFVVVLSCDKLCNENSPCTINKENAGRIEECCRNSSHNFTLYFGDAGGELTISDLILTNCTKPIIIESISSVLITDVTFSGFRATVLDIFNVSNVTVDNCTFESNANNGTGTDPFRGNAGAIAVGYPNDTVSNESINIVIKNSMFINNFANTSSSTDSVLIKKIFSGRGGAVALYLPSSNSTVMFVSELNQFIGNNASSAGGAIYAYLTGDFADVTLHVKNCNFTGNYAEDGAGIEFTYNLNKSACVVSMGDCDADSIPCLSTGPRMEECVHFPAHTVIEDCNFENNVGVFGGAFKGIQINPFGNNNFIMFKNCLFMNNSATVGAGAYFQSRYSIADVKMNDSIRMEDCNFTSNSGPRGIVFMIRNRVDFIGTNRFDNNTGPSIRLVGTLVAFNGEVCFNKNRHHSEGLSGTLYLSSFGQMLLENETNLYFTDNTGSDGAAIVVKSPRVSSSFSRQLYNPQCFLQYFEPTTSPANWTAKLYFAGNKARVGPVMFVSNLAACEWYSLNSSHYFEQDNLIRWKQILNISDTICNCVMNSNAKNCSNINTCDNTSLIQTEVNALDLTDNSIIEKSPGESVQVNLQVLDEQKFPTIAFLKIDVDTSNLTCNVTFEPSIIPVSPEDRNINFKFRSTRNCTNKIVEIIVSAPFAINPVEPESFKLKILPCLPGFNATNSTGGFLQCNCDTESNVLYCSPDQSRILLKDGTWAASPDVLNGRRELVTSPCPAGYCECVGISGLTRTGCALPFNGGSICVDDRKGFLCGECNKSCTGSEKAGIGVLTTKCRCSNDQMAFYLIPLVVLYGVAATLIIVLVNYPLPSCLKGILFYVQVAAISTQFFPEDFNTKWEIADCIANGLSLFFPYDFNFMPGLTALSAYGLRYIPIAVVIIVAPIALWIRMRFVPKMVFEGIWTLVLLTYAHMVYTSTSIVNCRDLDDKLHWFVNGSVVCYENGHLGLAFLAIILLILAAALHIFVGVIIYHPKIKGFSQLPDKVLLLVNNLRLTLINGYRSNYEFWPVVELLRRFIFIVAVVLTPGELTLPLLLILIVFGAHVFVYPYADKLSNHIESFVLFVLITMLMLGNTTALVERTKDTSEHEQFFILLFVPLYLVLLLFVCYITYQLCILIQSRFKINIKSWNIHKQSSTKRLNKDHSTPEVTCTQIDLSNHQYQVLTTTDKMLVQEEEEN